MALAIPVFLAIVTLAFAGCQEMTGAIDLATAARAGAAVAGEDLQYNASCSGSCVPISSTQIQHDVLTAVEREENSTSFVYIAPGSPCPGSCFSMQPASTSTQMEVVTVISDINAWVPAVPRMQVSVQAAAGSFT